MSSAKLKVTRNWTPPSIGLGGVIAEVTPVWSVVVDGTVRGTFARGQAVEVPIDPGRHTLQVRSPKHESPVRIFEVSEGQEVTFRARHAVFIPELVAAMIRKDRWISLKQQQGQSGHTLA